MWVRVVATMVALACTGAAPASGDVLAYRGDGGRNAEMPDDLVFGPLRQVWTRTFPSYVNSPLLVGDKVIVNLSRDSSSGAGGSDVAALDVATGRELWRQPTPGMYFSAHITSDGQSVFSLSASGALRAFAVADGAPRWEHQVGDQVTGLPVTAGQLVLAPVQNATNSKSEVVAVRATDGQEVWRRTAAGGRLLVEGDRVFATGCGIDALRLDDGQPLWQARPPLFDDCDRTHAVVRAGRVYGPDTAVRDAATGAEVGQLAIEGDPAFTDGLIATGIGEVHGMDLSGNRLWTVRDSAESDSNAQLMPPIVVGPTVFAMGRGADLMSIDRATGQLLYRTRVPNEIVNAVGGVIGGMAAGNGILAITQNGALTAFTGALRPPPDGTDITASQAFVFAGRRVKVIGAVGSGLAGRPVELQADRYPFGHWRTIARGAPRGDRTFAADARLTRNAHFRLVVPGAAGAQPAIAVDAGPRIRSQIRSLDRGRASVRIRVVGPKDMPVRGRLVYVYLGRVRARRFDRLGSVRVRAIGASERLTVRLTHAHSDDVLAFCIPRLYRLGYGRRDAFFGHCGARRIHARVR